MSVLRIVRAGGPVLVVALLVAGCSRAVVAAPAPVQEDWKGCRAVGAYEAGRENDLPKGSVPVGFAPTQVVLCDLASAATPAPGGEAEVRAVERRTADVTPMLSYVNRPSEQRRGVCVDLGWVAPWLFFVDADRRWVAAQLPVDACGQPQPGLPHPTWQNEDLGPVTTG